jgi:hypothetical protein
MQQPACVIKGSACCLQPTHPEAAALPQRGGRRGDMLGRQGQALGRRSSRGIRGSSCRCGRRGRRRGRRRHRVSQRCAAAHEQHRGVRDHADCGAAGRVVLDATGCKVRRFSAWSTASKGVRGKLKACEEHVRTQVHKP